MNSRHIKRFGTLECAACNEIASYKWKDDFCCKRPGCGNITWREGQTPYSRRCLLCNRDESVTAHTVFDKVRMPRASCVEIVKAVIENNTRYKLEEITSLLKEMNMARVNLRSVWSLLGKIYLKMTAFPVTYDTSAVFIAIARKKDIVVIAKGKSEGKVLCNAISLLDERQVHNYIKNHTSADTKTAYFTLRYINTPKAKLRSVDINYRSAFKIKKEKVWNIANDFYKWHNHISAYLFKRNGGTYDELMLALTQTH